MFNKRVFFADDDKSMKMMNKLMGYLKFNYLEWVFSCAETRDKKPIYIVSWYSEGK